MRVLVTGAAGFIGYYVARRLLGRGDDVVGLDNLNAYYDVSLKEARLANLRGLSGFEFVRAELADRAAMTEVLTEQRFDAIVNLAAQAGVRYSIDNPHAYVDANVVGFLNVREGAPAKEVGHVVFASTSSVYGINTGMPFSEGQNTDHPISIYSATKKANEAMAHAYAHLFRIPCSGLRFFTVYGPWGRPDMALFKFTKGILAAQPIPVFNGGHMIRDFTYIDDIVEGVVRVIDQPAACDPGWTGDNPDPATSSAPWRIYNIGNSDRVELTRYIRALEGALGTKARLELLPMQAGDVPATQADTTALERAIGFKPATPVEEGVRRFVEWDRGYYKT